MLTVANALSGRMDATQLTCARLQTAIPGSTIDSVRGGQPKKLFDRIEPVLAGLRFADLPHG
jgi:hypothetical protein